MRMHLKVIGYWTTTAVVAGVLLFGILGCWKRLGPSPCWCRVFLGGSEWAYAGAFFDMTGTAASNLVCGYTMNAF